VHAQSLSGLIWKVDYLKVYGIAVMVTCPSQLSWKTVPDKNKKARMPVTGYTAESVKPKYL